MKSLFWNLRESCRGCGRISGRLVRFATENRVVLSSGLISRMSCKYPDVRVTRICRFCGPKQIRNFSTRRDGEPDLQGVGGRVRSGTGIADGINNPSGARKFPKDPGNQMQGKDSSQRSAWPWVSVIPGESSGCISRVQKEMNEGNEHFGPALKYGSSVEPPLHLFPLSDHPQLDVRKPLKLFLVDVPEKICNILSKYCWSAHTLLELRALMADGTVLKSQHVLVVLIRQRHAEVAYNFLQWAWKEMNCKLDIKCFTVVMPLLGRVRKYDLLENLLEDLSKKGYKLDKIIFTAAMRCYAEGQRMQEALQLFIQMKDKGFKPDCVTYSVLIQMFSKARLYQEALKLYDEMIALGVATDTQLYNCVVSTFGKAGRLDLAYEKLEEMRVRGHIPDQFTYGVLLEGYAKAGRLEFLDLYREMKSAGIPLNEVIFNIMFFGIERMGTLNDAESVFADMERVGLSANLNSFSALVAMCSKKGDFEGTQLWFDRMMSMGLEPTIAVGNSLLDSYARAKQIGKAKLVLDSFQKWGLTPNLLTLTVCLRCLSFCERAEDLDIVHRMLPCHSGSQFVLLLLDKSAGKNAVYIIASFLSTLHSERRQSRRDFVNVLINYLYKGGFHGQAYQVWEGALANHVFPALVEQGPEGICSINLMGMECGTAITALTHAFPRLTKQFHRREMAPEWVQIYTTAPLREEIPNRDPNSMHHAIGMLLQTLHSPFHADSLQTGFVCRGEEVVNWLDEPEVKAMLAIKY